VEAFLRAFNDKFLRIGVRDREPRDLDHALQIALPAEANSRAHLDNTCDQGSRGRRGNTTHDEGDYVCGQSKGIYFNVFPNSTMINITLFLVFKWPCRSYTNIQYVNRILPTKIVGHTSHKNIVHDKIISHKIIFYVNPDNFLDHILVVTPLLKGVTRRFNMDLNPQSFGLSMGGPYHKTTRQ